MKNFGKCALLLSTFATANPLHASDVTCGKVVKIVRSGAQLEVHLDTKQVVSDVFWREVPTLTTALAADLTVCFGEESSELLEIRK